MKKLIHYNPDEAGKLHCDACGYDMPEPVAFTAELIGTPCPKCGADMLTRADFEKTKKLFRIVDRINAVGAFFGLGHERPPVGAEAHRINVKIHGNTTTIKSGKEVGNG